MEKNGSVVLTPEDIQEFKEGRVSQRLSQDWGLTYSELSEIIASQTNQEEQPNV